MVLYGICLNRLKTALRKVDKAIEQQKVEDPSKIILEAYFLTEPDEIRRNFHVPRPKKKIQDDITEIGRALSRHTRKRLSLEFIEERDGLCLCYYPEEKK